MVADAVVEFWVAVEAVPRFDMACVCWACVCVPDCVLEFRPVLEPAWTCAGATAAEPAELLVWAAVERLPMAREPRTAIPAKPPVAVVTLAARERRRWEWRTRRTLVLATAASPKSPSSDAAEPPAAKIAERGAACAPTRAFTRLRPGSAAASDAAAAAGP